MTNTLTLGTRASALALAQTELTRSALKAVYPELEIRIETFVTQGDKKLDLNLLQGSPGGGKGLFTRELEEALLDRRIDVAVHSLKDLPGHMPDGLELSAVLERAACGDMLISKHPGGLEGLPAGARVGTSSIRRASQLAWLRADLKVAEWRGNVQTRLRKLGQQDDFDAIVLAQAGLNRLGFETESGFLCFEALKFHASSLESIMYPAIGQGVVALQSALERKELRALLQNISHAGTWLAVRAERELQRLLSGDCTLPVGVRTSRGDAGLRMDAVLFSAASREPVRGFAEGVHPETVAGIVAAQLTSAQQARL